MKKRMLVALLVLVLVVGLGLTAFAVIRLGDVNGDGKLTAFDGQLIAEYRAAKRELTDTQKEAAGDLSTQDIIEEIRNQEPEKIYPVVGLLTPLPPETIRMRPTIADNPLYYQKGQYAVKQNDAQKSVSIELLGINGTPAGIEFYDKDQPIDSDAWALYVDMCYQVESAKNGVCSFFITQDEQNAACIKFVQKVTGDSYIKRSIYRDGERMQQVEESGNAPDEHLLQIPSGTEWSGKLLFMFYDGWIYFFLQNDAGQYLRVTSYEVDYTHATPQLEVSRYMNVQLTNIHAVTDKTEVAALYNELLVPENVKGTHRALFLSNSNIFYFDTPNVFARLAKEAGYYVEVNAVAGSGAALADFNSSSNYLHTLYQKELKRGYDVVYMNGLSGDIKSQEREEYAIKHAGILADAIREAGGTPALYARPCRKLVDNDGDGTRETLVVYTDGKGFNDLYTEMGQTHNMDVCYPVRAFALAHQENPDINLWYTDHAHASQTGAYLNGCVLFCHTFGVSCENVGDDFLDPETAAFLRDIADRVVLEGEIPNW